MARIPGTRPVILETDDNPTKVEVEVQERWTTTSKYTNPQTRLFCYFYFLFFSNPYLSKYIYCYILYIIFAAVILVVSLISFVSVVIVIPAILVVAIPDGWCILGDRGY